MEGMTQELRDALDALLMKPKGQLTETEVGFLRARRDYLTEAERGSLADLLEDAPVEKPAKKSKK